MIELRKIRTYIPPNETAPALTEKPFEPRIYFEDIHEVLREYEKVIDAIPKDERINLYVTLNHVSQKETAREKSWVSQEYLMWDIDNVKQADKALYSKYVKALATTISIDEENLVTLETGGGFHIVMRIKNIITDKNWFKAQALNYQILCIAIDEKFKEMGLSGTVDRQVFAPNRMWRMPGSISQKPGRPDFAVRLLQGANAEAIDWDIQKATGMPDLNPDKDFMSDKELSYIKIDSSEVEKGCEFLKFAKAQPQGITEPMWYAVIGIVGRLENGTEKVHEYSKGHHSYSPQRTERKLEQALKSSGPRTCENIEKLWGQCNKCANYKKCRSPIALKGKDFIATAHSGFHTIDPKGRLIPQYDDLRKFYEQETPYINAANSHYQFQSTHWVENPDVHIDNYAESKFSPPAKNVMCAEFRGKIKRTNLRDPDWFSENTDRLLNFQNGVLNIDTMELVDHDQSFGFQNVLPFDYDPDAEAPEFRKVLENITCGDQSKQIVLTEFLGYALSNDEPKADKILVLTGEGRNGKSRFLNIWKALGGPGVRALGITELMNPFYLQRLDGALFNISEEIPSFQKKEFWELMKHLSTGGTVTVSRKFKDPYDFQNKAKFIMTCNQLPQGADQNHGFFRRLLIVDFNAKFSDADGNIDRDIDRRVIENEMPGVANIAIKMYHRLKTNNYRFTQSDAIDRSLDEYQKTLDSVYRWSEEHIELGIPKKGDLTRLDAVVETELGLGFILEELRKDYAQWCLNNGEKPVHTKLFSKRLFEFVGRLGARFVDTSRGHITHSYDGINVATEDLTPSKNQECGHLVYKMRARCNGVKKMCIVGVVYGCGSE